jgi:hypothetical protein
MRVSAFLKLGLFNDSQIQAFLTERRHHQPWAIYYSRDGGLGVPDSYVPDLDACRGVVPCSSMTNHGVAWRRNGSLAEYWLATAPKRGGVWDLDSDIGHESAHAAFAQVPLFAQTSHLAENTPPLSTLPSARQLETGNFARMCYMYSELAVVAIRGEERDTQTHLPVGDREELLALLRLSDELMPSAGFDDALEAVEGAKSGVSLEATAEIGRIAAPIVRVLPHLKGFVRSSVPPDHDFFRQLADQLSPVTAPAP